MAVKIRLKRLGKIRNPQYRIVVADSRTKRDGRAIEEIGKYHPKEEPSLIEVNSERAQYWLGVGAQPSEPVLHLLKLTGDWQRFQGDPNAVSTVRYAEPKADKKVAYDQAAKEAASESGGGSKKLEAKSEARAEKKTEPKAEKKAEPKSEPKAEKKAETAEPAEPKAEKTAEPTETAETPASGDAASEA